MLEGLFGNATAEKVLLYVEQSGEAYLGRCRSATTSSESSRNGQLDFGELRLLTPMDCVMDRLAGYYHWKDPQSLDQAVAVARRRQKIDLQRIERWSRRRTS